MQCNFCKEILPTQVDLQIHQVNKCPAIENKDFKGPKSIMVTFNWTPTPQDKAYMSVVTCPNLLLSNYSESIELNVLKPNGEYSSECKHIFQGCYQGQLVLDSHIIPITDFYLTSTTDMVNISTIQKTETNLPVICATNLPVMCPNDVVPPTPNPSTLPRMCMNYNLNKESNLSKKIRACDRQPYAVKHNNGSVTITMNTMCFEHMRSSLIQYLERQTNQYNFQITPKVDMKGNTAEDIIQVTGTPESTALFTINMYRTTSRIMVNGPQPHRFMENDFPVITNAFDNNFDELEEENMKAKNSLLSLKKNSAFVNQSNLKQQEVSKKTIMTRSRSRLSDATSSDLATNNSTMDTHPQNLTTSAVEKVALNTQEREAETQCTNHSIHTNSPEDLRDSATSPKTSIPTADTNSDKFNDNNQSNTRKSSRSIDKTEKARLEEERKQKKITSDKTSPPLSDSDSLDPVCPKCKKIVDSEGVVCEACQAYWHYICANLNENEIKKLDGQDFFCEFHKKNIDGNVTIDALENNSNKTMNNEAVDNPKNQAMDILKSTAEEVLLLKEKHRKEAEKSAEKLTKSQKEMDNLKQDHEKLVHQLKQEILTWQNKSAKTESSLEIINRRVATLEKEKIMYNSTATQSQQTISELNVKIDGLEKEKTELQKEIKTHKEINEQLIANPQREKTSEESQKIKDQKREIDSLKLKVVNLETVVKEKEKSIQSIQTDLYSTRKDKERMGQIIDRYMSGEPSGNNLNLETSGHRAQANNTSASASDNDLTDTGDVHINRPPNMSNEVGAAIREQRKKIMCRYELKGKDKCHHGDLCHFNHQITDEQRKGNTNSRSQEGMTSRAQGNQQPCAEEFYSQRCTIRGCNDKHQLDHHRIRRGPCLFEFYKIKSCPHGDSKCRFSHEIPVKCLSDPVIIDHILEKINKSKNKEKLRTILGQEVMEAAELRRKVAGAQRNAHNNGANAHQANNSVSGTDQVSPIDQPGQYTHGTVSNSTLNLTASSHSSQWTHNQGTSTPPNYPALQQVHLNSQPSLQQSAAQLQSTYQFPYFLPHVSKEMINKEQYRPLISLV